MARFRASTLFQAEALWAWSNFLHSRVPTGKIALRLNLDETAIKLYQDGGVGFLTKRGTRNKQTHALHRNVTRGQLRTTFTHVAVVCDDPGIQPSLPHILIVNKHMMTQQTYERICNTLPANVQLWRLTSSWVNIASMVRIVDAIGRSLSAFRDTHQVLLGMDSARVHSAVPVWRACARNSVFAYVIPAKLTWCLQVLDTHVFAGFKQRLKMLCQKSATDAAADNVSFEVTVTAVCESIAHSITAKSWAKAFADLGLVGHQREVSTRVLDKLSMAAVPAVHSTVPTLSQLQYVFPKRTIIPIDDVFAAVTKPLRQSHGMIDRRVAGNPVPSSSVSPWIGRLRSFSAPSSVQPPVHSSAAPPWPPPPPVPPPGQPPPAPAPPLLRLSSRARLPPQRRLPEDPAQPLPPAVPARQPPMQRKGSSSRSPD